MLESILNSSTQTGVTVEGLLMCMAASLVLGIVASFLYMYKNTYAKGFVVTLALLPSIVQVVIMLVNGNLGAGVAVMGAFSLIRFRSVAGGGREIGSVFLAMAIGLATGMGYVGIAALLVLVVGAASLLLHTLAFGEGSKAEKELRITIPESLEFDGLFDDILEQYAKKSELIRIKTTAMGSMFELRYNITLKQAGSEKALLDDIRIRNGNLNVTLGKVSTFKDEL
jgi:uncharacterized membrane protein YhiD involved in acid resistance